LTLLLFGKLLNVRKWLFFNEIIVYAGGRVVVDDTEVFKEDGKGQIVRFRPSVIYSNCGWVVSLINDDGCCCIKEVFSIIASIKKIRNWQREIITQYYGK